MARRPAESEGSGIAFWFWTLALTVGALFGISYWIENKDYIFHHEELEQIAMKYKGTTLPQSFKSLVRDIKTRFGFRILEAKPGDFFLMNAGGWMGQVCVLHASLTEYVLIFHTVQETQGHSVRAPALSLFDKEDDAVKEEKLEMDIFCTVLGRYWLNITDFVIGGWMEQWKEKSFKVQNFSSGVTVHHPWLTSAGVRFGADSWFLEYGRGFVPSSMMFASADVFFSTHDFVSWYHMVAAFCTGLMREAYIWFDGVFAEIHAW